MPRKTRYASTGMNAHHEKINAAMNRWSPAYIKGLKAGEKAHRAARRGVIVGVEQPYVREHQKSDFLRGFNLNFYGKEQTT